MRRSAPRSAAAGPSNVNGQKVGDLSQLAGSLDDGKLGLFSTETATFEDVHIAVLGPDEPFPPPT